MRRSLVRVRTRSGEPSWPTPVFSLQNRRQGAFSVRAGGARRVRSWRTERVGGVSADWGADLRREPRSTAELARAREATGTRQAAQEALYMIECSRRQLSFAEGLIQEEVGPLWEEWMRQVDEVLRDEELLSIVYEALARRWPKSRTHGRPGTPAEVVLRLLLLKHMRNWSYQVLEREVRANLVYRQFTRVGAEKVPDAKTLGKLAVALGPEIIAKIHARVVAIACEKGIVRGRRLRVDTTVVETDIHYPTDSSLLGDGVRVLTRTMQRITKIAGRAGTKLRDRTRAVGYQVRQIARASRSRMV